MSILVSVTNDSGNNWLVLVNTTSDQTQARWDAYCYCYGDESPQQETVDAYTTIQEIMVLNDPKDAFRD